jgi:diguanylate cyclase (GGDEF)-like protein/PAS domain S-box-containing protein
MEPPGPETTSRVTLRRSLYWRFCALVVGAIVLFSAGYAIFGLRPMVPLIASSQFGIATSRVEASIDRTIQPIDQLMRAARGWAMAPGFDVERVDDFNALFRPVIEAIDPVTSIVAGTSDGQGWLLLAYPDGSWRNRMTDRSRWGNIQHFIDRSASGQTTERREPVDYDPRDRPWYQHAMATPANGKVHWTAPYVFFTTGAPGVTASTRVDLPDGRSMAIGFDILLSDLSHETSGIKVGASGYSLILTDDGRILGLPRRAAGWSEEAFQASILKSYEDLNIAAVTASVRQWHSEARPQERVLRFVVDDTAWLASFQRHALGDQTLWVASMAPQSEFIPAWGPMLGALAALTAIVVALALLIAHALARNLSRPLEALVVSSKRIAVLDFTPPPPLHSGLREMQQLVSAQDTVRTMLGKYRATVEAQEKTLKEQVAALQTTKARLQLVASVFTHAQEGIYITDPDGRIVEVNDAFTRITRFPREEAIGQTPRILRSGRHGEEFYAMMWQNLITKGHWYGEIWNKRKDDEVFPGMLSITAVRDSLGRAQHYVALFTDITVLKEHQRQLEHIAHYDALTGLPNRVLLGDRLLQAIAQTRRHEKLMALVYFDLDGFKPVNDTYGHDLGDELLVAVAQCMKKVLRQGDTLARLGGDEFVIVLTDLDDVAECREILFRLLRVCATPHAVRNHVLSISASMGVTLFPLDGSDPDTLLRHADQAMYQAKQAGKNRFHLFDPEQDRLARTHRESLQHISQALANNEFVLYYQPKVNMRTGAVIGAEALIRWQHPQRGLLPPGEFLPVIEDSDTIVDIGDWVLDTALTQIEAWHAQGLDIAVSVNISARQLQRDDFVSRLMEKLAAHSEVSADRLELEVLETAALEDIARVSQVMEVCRNLGVSFSLDDFGTGYSSLTYLKRLPANELKIDQSFVRDMLQDPEDMAIVEGIIGLAAAFRRTVIAEGVETAEHGQLLLRLGCDLGQGYGIARPMPAQAMPDWVRNWQPDPGWLPSNDLPFNRDDLPLMFIEIEHRHWVRSVQAHINASDEATAPPTDLCRFSAWFERDGRARYGHLKTYAALAPLHARLHTLGHELLELKANGEQAQARNRLAELLDLHEQFALSLQQLIVSSQHPVDLAQ